MHKLVFYRKNKFASVSLLLFIGVYLFVFIMNLSNIIEFGAKKHYRSIVLGSTLCNTAYIGIVFFTLLSKGFVMTLHTPNIIFILVCQFLVMLSAMVVYAWLIRKFRFKKVTIFALILLSVIFYYGSILEIYLSESS